MRVFSETVHFVLSSLLICCYGKIYPDEVITPPYRLLTVRAEKLILPILPYGLGDLEPYIDRDTVVAHYEGHHEAYRRKMNAALNDWREDVSLTGTILLILSACSPNGSYAYSVSKQSAVQSPKYNVVDSLPAAGRQICQPIARWRCNEKD